jgi:hypothetical protein
MKLNIITNNIVLVCSAATVSEFLQWNRKKSENYESILVASSGRRKLIGNIMILIIDDD